MNSFPFDSDVTYDGDGNPIFDRAYDSENLRSYFHLMFTDGIFMVDNSIALLVTTSEQDMSVVVKEGNVNIQGALGIETSDRTLVFEAAGTTYDRIDAVVARLNTNHDYRKIDLYVVKGTEATAPVAPSITRTGGIYELRLANVFIAKNTTTISAERITDTRLVTDECGVVTANPQGTDTEQIFNQYQASLDAYMQYVEECIDGTTAGNLQNQITALFNNQADEFSATKTYEVGDYCIYQNKLYKCVTAIETGAAWDSSKWEATTVGGEMASLNKGYAQLNSSLSHKDDCVYLGGSLSTALNEISLKEPIDNFKQLLFVIRWGNSPFIYTSMIMPESLYEVSGRRAMLSNIDCSIAGFRSTNDKSKFIMYVAETHGLNETAELYGIK